MDTINALHTSMGINALRTEDSFPKYGPGNAITINPQKLDDLEVLEFYEFLKCILINALRTEDSFPKYGPGNAITINPQKGRGHCSTNQLQHTECANMSSDSP